MANIRKYVNRFDDYDTQVLDKGVKNSWSWNWLERQVDGVYVRDTIRKVKLPGTAYCILCNKDIQYGNRGFLCISSHLKSTKHVSLQESSDLTSREEIEKATEEISESKVSRRSSYLEGSSETGSGELITPDMPSGNQFNEPTVQWNIQMIRLLLSIYADHLNDFKSPYLKKKHVWGKIAVEMQKTYSVTPLQCENKFKALTAKYKKVKDANNTSGSNFKSWVLFRELEQLLEADQDPNVGQHSQPVNESQVDEASNSDTELLSPREKRRKIATTKLMWDKFTEEANRRHEEREEREDVRLSLKLERQDRFLDLFEKFISK